MNEPAIDASHHSIMSGLFGFVDWQGDLPPDTGERMASYMTDGADRATVILQGDEFCIGCSTKGIYPGEGEVLSSADANRKCLFTGRLLETDGDASERWDPIAAAQRAFLDDATATRLAATNGPFAAAIWDGDRRRLELITDRHGMYPIYVASYRSAFLFSGQIKGIWAVGVVPTDVNPLAICLMLSTGELVSDITLFRDIRLLSAGSRTAVSSSGIESERYWGYEFQERDDLDFSAAAQQLGGLLRRGVERICRHSSSVGVPLSGGLDSRVLLAATPDPSDVPSFTWGVEGCRDLRYASAAADAVGSPHQSFVFDGEYLKRFAAFGVWLTEGQLPAVDFHVLPYVTDVARKCDVILNGYAGDAILGGNFIKKNWWHARTREKAVAALWQWRDIQCPPDFRHRILGKAMEGCDFSDARLAFEGALLAMPGETPMAAAQAFLLAHRVRRRTSCGTALMRWRVESDHPFFDNDFFDFAGSLPYGWRYRHRLYIEVMRRCFPEVAGVRWQRTGLPAGASYTLMYGALVLHKLDRIRVTKRFFKGRQVSDFGGWMRGPLRGYLTELLTDARTLDRGWFVADTVRAVLHDHLEARADHSSFLGSMISLELFARLFVDRDDAMVSDRRREPPPIKTIRWRSARPSERQVR